MRSLSSLVASIRAVRFGSFSFSTSCAAVAVL
jgi:hypothetical protein